MRVTRETPGFWRYKATINGKPPIFCVEADEEQGYVACIPHLISADGRPIPDPDHQGQLVTQHGRVEIVPPDDRN